MEMDIEAFVEEDVFLLHRFGFHLYLRFDPIYPTSATFIKTRASFLILGAAGHSEVVV